MNTNSENTDGTLNLLFVTLYWLGLGVGLGFVGH